MDEAMRALLMILFMAGSVYAEFAPQELRVINWGSEDTQLKIIAPHLEGEGTEQEFTEPGMGPNVAAVDERGNFIFSSYDLGYLKGFDSEGKILFNLLDSSTIINSRLGGQTINDFVINTSLIYIIGFPGLPVVPIVDYNGDIVDSLMPYEWNPWVTIFGLVLNYDGSMNIDRSILNSRQFSRYVVTYRNGHFYPGGSLGFWASNASYYAAWRNGPHQLGFNKFNNPDTAGETNDVITSTIDFPSDSLDSAEILNGGDGSSLYVYVINTVDDHSSYEVWEFDLDYNLKSKVVFPLAENIYEWFIRPFVSHDGAIYEFRCLDDGLHVVKWTKQ